MRLTFGQPAIRLQFGRSRAGGTGVLLLDGEVIDRLDFGSRSRRTRVRLRPRLPQPRPGSHTLVLRVRDGAGYVDHFVVGR